MKPTSPAECEDLINAENQGDFPTRECQPFLRSAAFGLLKNWEMATALSASVGARFIPVLQPIPSFPAGSRVLNPFLGANGLGQHELSGYGYSLITSEISSQLNLSTMFADVAKDSKKCNYYYVDLAH